MELVKAPMSFSDFKPIVSPQRYYAGYPYLDLLGNTKIGARMYKTTFISQRVYY